MKYKFTFETVVEIEATNAVAAKKLASELKFGIGPKCGGDTSPSGEHDRLNWKFHRNDANTKLVSQELIS